jgi:hypothetical protein
VQSDPTQKTDVVQRLKAKGRLKDFPEELKAKHEARAKTTEDWVRRGGRPKGSNADEWHLWLSFYADSRAAFPDVLDYLAVHIAEAIERATERGHSAGYQQCIKDCPECMKEWRTTR